MGTLPKDPLGMREHHAKPNTFHAFSGQPRRRRTHAFTLLELMIIMSIVCVLFALLIPASIKAKAKSKRISCVSNLKLQGLLFRVFATDHADRFPWEINTNITIKTYDEFLGTLSTLSNEFSELRQLTCPADTRKPAPNWSELNRTNISYLFSPSASETYPQSFLAGDRNLMTNGVRLPTGIVTLSTNAVGSWDTDMHQRQGNAVMGDGSVQQLSAGRLRIQLRNTGVSEMKLAVP